MKIIWEEGDIANVVDDMTLAPEDFAAAEVIILEIKDNKAKIQTLDSFRDTTLIDVKLLEK